MTTKDADAGLADKCLPFLARGPLTCTELRGLLRDRFDSSAIYRVLCLDDRVAATSGEFLTSFSLKGLA